MKFNYITVFINIKHNVFIVGLVGLGQDGEASDGEEPPSGVREVSGGVVEGGAESDAEDLLVETESDSDQSNQDAASAQRSVQTGATAGSDTGMFLVANFVISYHFVYYFAYFKLCVLVL